MSLTFLLLPQVRDQEINTYMHNYPSKIYLHAYIREIGNALYYIHLI